jgi:hypothetical protein
MRILWRGDLALARTFWVHHVVATLVLAPIAGAAVFLAWQDRPYSLAAALALIAVIAVYIILAMVGLWRSAGRHAHRGGRVAARLLVVVELTGLLAIPILAVELSTVTFSLPALFSAPSSPLDAKEEFAALDSDRSHGLSAEEMNHLSGLDPSVGPEVRAALFRSLDANGDGVVDLREFTVGGGRVASVRSLAPTSGSSERIGVLFRLTIAEGAAIAAPSELGRVLGLNDRALARLTTIAGKGRGSPLSEADFVRAYTILSGQN